jgi:dTDP-4-amino-4,6-dideoxygalactose transaminase
MTAMTTSVPLVDLVAAQREVYDDIAPGVEEVLRSGGFVGGPHVAAFERAYAEFCSVAHCIGVANGTDAVELALRAVGVQEGDEVVLPVNTFIATAEAVARIGAVPVFADVDPLTLLIDPLAAAAAVTPATRAVVVVHLYGQTAPVERIAALIGDDITIVEDAAQSQGATRLGRPAGSLADIAATSFYPGKNLGAAGDAGAVTTDDADLAREVRLVANHGSVEKYVHDAVGFNSRLDAIQAVVLTAKLARLREWNARRRAAAARYDDLLAGLPEVVRPTTLLGNVHAWHLYVVQVDDRARVLELLHREGIGASVHYPYPLHLTPAFADTDVPRGRFPVAEAAAERILSLPLHPHLTPADQEHVVDVLARAVSGR